MFILPGLLVVASAGPTPQRVFERLGQNRTGKSACATKGEGKYREAKNGGVKTKDERNMGKL